MNKETYYFTHDYNARKDPKCIALLKDFGTTGYGLYWCLVEVMYEQGGKIKKFPSLFAALAHDFNVSEKMLSKQIEAMLHKYELLLQDDKYIWSDAVIQRLHIREAKRSKKIEAGKKGGIKSGILRSKRKQIEAKVSGASGASINKNTDKNIAENSNDATHLKTTTSKQNEANEAKKRKEKEIIKEINKEKNLNGELIEMEINNSIEYCDITFKRKYNTVDLKSLWKGFLIYVGDKPYVNRGEKITHFRNWIKLQPYSEVKKETKRYNFSNESND